METRTSISRFTENFIQERKGFIWLLDKDLKFSYVNDRFVAEYKVAFGIVPCIGEYIFKSVPKKIWAKWEKRYRRVMETRKEERFTYPQQASGQKEIKYYEVILMPAIKDEEVVGVTGLGFDATEIVWYKEVFRHTPDIVYEHSLEGIFTKVSDSAFPVMGYTPEEVIGMKLNDFLDEEGIAIATRETNAKIKQPHTRRPPYELIIRKKDGTHVWSEILSWPIMTAGEVVGIRGFIRDVGDRKSAMDRYASFIENSPIGVFVSTPSGQLLQANDRLGVILGYMSGEEMLNNVSNIAVIYGSPEERLAIIERTRKTPDKFVDIETEMKKADGSSVSTLMIIRSTKDIMGTYGLRDKEILEGFMLDITEKKQAMTRIQRLNDCLSGLGASYQQNIDKITALCGEMLTPDEVVYARIEGRRLLAVSRWGKRLDKGDLRKPKGCLALEFFDSPDDFISHDNLKDMDIGACSAHKVKVDRGAVGALCLNYSASGGGLADTDKEFLGIMAAAIGGEEKRRISSLALYVRDEKYRNLIETSRTMLWEISKKGIIRDISPSCETIMGWSRIDLVGQPFCKFMEVENAKELQYILKLEKDTLISDNGQPEGHVITKEGDHVWLLFQGMFILKDGEVSGWRGTGTDITDRKLRELRLIAIKDISRMLLSEPLSYDKYVATLGATVYFKRTLLFLKKLDASGNDVFALKGAWRAPGVPALNNSNREFDFKNLGFENWIAKLTKGETILEPAEQLPVVQRDFFFKYGVTDETIIIAPIVVDETLLGLLGIVGRKLGAEDAAFLQTAGSLLAQSMIRQKAESVIAKKEQQLRRLTDSVPDIIMSIARGGRIIFVNPAVESILGYSQEEVLAFPKGIYELLHPGDSKSADGLANGTALEWPMPILVRASSEEKTIYLEIHASPGVNDEGGAQVEAIARDVTTKVIQEQQLRVSERRYKAIIEHSNLLAVMLNSKGEINYCNSLFLELTGYLPAEVIGQKYADLFVPVKGIDTFNRLFNDAVRRKMSPPVTRGRLCSRRNERLLVEWNNTILFGPNMEVLGVASVGTDVTSRYIAEKKLQESEEKYRTLIENLPVGVCRTTAEPASKFLAANAAMARMLGYETFKDLMKVSPQDLYLTDSDRKLFSWRAEKKKQSSMDVTLKKKDGTIFYGMEAATPIKDAQGNILYFDYVIEDITEKRKAQDNLRQILDHMRTGIVITAHRRKAPKDKRKAPRGDVLFFNWSLMEMMGHSQEDLFPQHLTDIIHEDYLDIVDSVLQVESNEQASTLNYEVKLKSASGVETWAQVHSSLIHWDGGTAIVLSFTDTTKRKLATDRLHLLHDMSIAIAQGAGEPIEDILRKILDGIIKGANMDSGCVYVAGGDGRLSLSFAIGLKGEIQSLISSVDPQNKYMQELSKGQPLYLGVAEIEKSISRGKVKKGMLKSMSVFPVIHNENPIALFLVSSHTLEEAPLESRSFMETAASEVGSFLAKEFAERQKAESEEFHRCLIENSQDGIFIIQQGIPVYMNHEFAGYSKDEMSSLVPQNFISDEDNALVLEYYAKVLKEKTPQQIRHRIKHKDGVIIWVNSSLIPITWKGQTAVLNYMRDINEMKKMEDHVFHAEKMEAIGTLAGGMAHDFNNVLMGIQGHTGLMLMKAKPTHKNYSDLKSIEQLVESGTSITRQLLGFAKGGMYDPRPMKVGEFLDKMVKIYSRTKREIVFHTKIAADIAGVHADKGQMEQVFMNLFLNAAQSMPSGGELFLAAENVSIEETTEFLPPGNYVKISITDTGVGMDDKTKDRLFEPFFTSKEMGRGTGLGLATVYGIIRNHGGYINVYSTRGYGTTFNLFLPAIGKTIKEKKETKRTGAIPKGTETILLIEDEERILSVTKRILEELGYKTLTALDGKEGVRVYNAHHDKISLVILDMIMPGYSGEKVFGDIRKINPQARVLLASGYSLNGQAERILSKGCMGFIQKPFGPRPLSEKIREILRVPLPETKDRPVKKAKKGTAKKT